MKKAILGYLGFFVVAMGTLVVSHFIGQNQDLRRSASTDKVDLSLNAPTTIVQGQDFTVDVIVDRTNTRQVTAADIQLNVSPAGSVQLREITKGNYFATSNMQVPPAPGNGYDTVGTQLLNDRATRRLAVGALCDYCYIGAAPNPNTYNLVQCPANPQCYPKTTTGTLATYHFTALTPGTVTFSFVGNPSSTEPTGTQIAATNSDTNVVGDLGTKNVTITSSTAPSPTPTTGAPSPTPGVINACSADINQSGQVTITDYTILRNDYLRVPPQNPRSDINGDGTVNLTDYTILRSFYLATCP